MNSLAAESPSQVMENCTSVSFFGGVEKKLILVTYLRKDPYVLVKLFLPYHILVLQVVAVQLEGEYKIGDEFI